MTVSKNAAATTEKTTPRQIKLPTRHWYKPHTWRRNLPLPPRRKLSSVIQLLKQTISLLRADWRTFAGITAFYGIGVLIFVRSFSIGSTETSSGLESSGSKVGETATLLAQVIGDATASLSAASGVYQTIISTICCLALIWAFRQILSNEKAGVRSSFYLGMAPLIKYLLVLAMLGVQLLPTVIGGYLMSIAIDSALLFGWELAVATGIFLMLLLWSLRLITPTIFALFIVTLPDMNPLRSIRSAKKMVYRRRLQIWRKLLGAAVISSIVIVMLLIPFVLWWSVGAPWMMFVASVVIVPIGQAYLYCLYREIL